MARLGLYQPFIEDRNVRRLYRMKVRFRRTEKRRMPMTVLLNRILDDFFDSQGEIEAEEGSAPGIPGPPAATAAREGIQP